jgi:hypothetical protein
MVWQLTKDWRDYGYLLFDKLDNGMWWGYNGKCYEIIKDQVQK